MFTYKYKKETTIKVLRCPECMSDNVKTTHKYEKLPLKENWRPVEFLKPKIICNVCKLESDALESLEAIHDATCIAMGVLPPQEIKRIRKELNYSNVIEFSRLLGLGDSTVKSWEARQYFPSKSQIEKILFLKELGVEKYKRLLLSSSLYNGGDIDLHRENTLADNIIELKNFPKKLSSEQEETKKRFGSIGWKLAN